MDGFFSPWLLSVAAIPLLGAAWVARVADVAVARRRGRQVATVTLLAAVCVSFGKLAVAGGAGGAGGADGADGADGVLATEPLSLALVPLAALIHLVIALSAPRTEQRRFSFAHKLLWEGLLLASLSCNGSWALVALLVAEATMPFWHLRARRLNTRPYAAHAALFAATLVAGWALTRASDTDSIGTQVGFGLLGVAVATRSGLVPLHCWVWQLFERSSFGAGLCATTPLLGAYAAVCFLTPAAPDWVLRLLGIAAILTALYTACQGLIQVRARRYFCCLLVSHSALVLAGLELATPLTLAASFCLWWSVALSLTGFGLTLRALEARCGELTLQNYRGMSAQTPMLAAFCLITGLAAVGFPGTIGFFGAEMLIEGASDIAVQVAVAVVLVAAVNGIGVVHTYSKLFLGTPHAGSLDLGCRPSERVAILLLIVLVLGAGFVPQLAARWGVRVASAVIQERELRNGG